MCCLAARDARAVRLLRDARARRLGEQADRRAGLGQVVRDLVLEVRDAVERGLVGVPQVRVVAHERRRDVDELVADVVERRDRVVEAPHAVGQAERVGRPDGQRLDLPDGVVAGVPDRARGQARQARHARLLDAPEHAPERLEDASALGLDLVRRAVAPRGPAGAVQPDRLAAALEHEVRVLAQERVAPQPLAALDRLEQEAERAGLAHREKRRDGRRQVGRAPHGDRDREAPAVGRALLLSDGLERVEGHGEIRFEV